MGYSGASLISLVILCRTWCPVVGLPIVVGWRGCAGGSPRPVPLLVAGVGRWWVC